MKGINAARHRLSISVLHVAEKQFDHPVLGERRGILAAPEGRHWPGWLNHGPCDGSAHPPSYSHKIMIYFVFNFYVIGCTEQESSK